MNQNVSMVSAKRARQPSTLLAFKGDVNRARAAFLRELNRFPDPLRKVAVRQYRQRMNKLSTLIPLGEYAPWLIADLLGISDHRHVDEIILPWLGTYFYVIFLDDVIDEHDIKHKGLLMIAAGLLLERSLNKLYSLAGNKRNLSLEIDKYFTQTALAGTLELYDHRRSIKEFCNADINALGKKLAILKLCMIYLSFTRGCRKPNASDFRTLDAFSTGIQLLDDITDWEEDWRGQSYTYPLTLTLKRLHSNGIDRVLDIRKLKMNEVLAGMIITRALEESLDMGTKFIRSALANCGVVNSCKLTEFLELTIQNNLRFTLVVQRAREALELEKLSNPDGNWLGRILQVKTVQQQIWKVKSAFHIVAQQS